MSSTRLVNFRKSIAIWVLLCGASGAWSNALDSLDAFIRNAKTGQATFTQVVTAPAKDGQVARRKTSSGSFEFSRPNRFRFVYKKPFEQTIVADGQTLWLYDVELNQVTARKQSAVLASTPAALIASAADIKSLQVDFALATGPDVDGLEWVVATPKAADSSLQSVRIGFRNAELTVLEILDSFGQRSVITFGAMQTNSALDAGLFQFKPPVGADVIRQ
jgi:outer membrane lipoprotein carrier protein